MVFSLFQILVAGNVAKVTLMIKPTPSDPFTTYTDVSVMENGVVILPQELIGQNNEFSVSTIKVIAEATRDVQDEFYLMTVDVYGCIEGYSTMQPQQTTMQPQQTTMQPKQTTMQPQQTTMLPPQTTMQPKQTTMQPQPTTMQPPQTTMQPQQQEHVMYQVHVQSSVYLQPQMPIKLNELIRE